MKYLLNLVIFGFVAWGIWKAANRWFDLLGGNRPPATPKQPVPPPQTPHEPPRETPQGRMPVVEDAHPCPVCGAYIAVGAAKCGRPDCPQP